MIDVKIKLITGGKLPEKMSAGAAGFDCYARTSDRIGGVWSGYLAGYSSVDIARVKVPLGFALSIPDGYEAHVRPRSGLGFRNGVHCAFGTIDADYTGEVCAVLFNLGRDEFAWKAGDRICQLVIAPVARVTLHQVDELTTTARGDGGFGSTGR